MRTERLTGEGRCFYHCVSRVVDKRFIFNDLEKNFFCRTMRNLEEFLGSGADLLTGRPKPGLPTLRVPDGIYLAATAQAARLPDVKPLSRSARCA